MSDELPFRPDWVSPPGETIADLLAVRRISRTQFATKLGETLRDVERLITGDTEITPGLAAKLCSVLGPSEEFWINREFKYRSTQERLETAEKNSQKDWLRRLPIKDMINLGWIDSHLAAEDPVGACLQFFNVPNAATWDFKYRDSLRAAFRTSPSFSSAEGAVSAWLRHGELKASQIECSDWNSDQFCKALSEVRQLTRQKNPEIFLPKLTDICASCGVAVVIARAPKGCAASGATQFLTPKKALMMLSFRYLSDDHFWFSFFHEAGHLILHQHLLFVEGESIPATKEEREANKFAAEILIPRQFENDFNELGADSIRVIRFARHIGISPGIVVGQLQHQGRIRQNQLNSLKRRYSWVAS